MAKRGLGRGLSSLIPSLSNDQLGLEEISIIDISPNPNQPRQRFGEEAFNELVASIGKHGVVQPVVVRPKEDGYELIAGERRWRAAKEAGLASIPAVIKRSDDNQSLQLALIENIQREDLNAIDEAVAYKQLMEALGCTQAELAEVVGKNRATVANTVRLLQLPDFVKQMIGENRLSSGHARALLALTGEAQQAKLADKVVREGLSVRQTEELARLWQLDSDKVAVAKPRVEPHIKTLARRFGRLVGVRVKTKMVGSKIRLEIDLAGPEDLQRLESWLEKTTP